MFGALVIMLGIGLLVGRFIWQPKPPITMTEQVNAQTILMALKDQGFLVTQSILSTQDVTIERSTGNALKDFFVGQTIRARGTMETNLGIDLSKLSDEDVLIEDQRITVRIPDTRLFNTRLVGDIEVENSQGIAKRIFQPDDGYNTALAELTTAAEAIAQDDSVLANARERSKEEIRRLVRILSPSPVEIQIEIKQQ